MDGERLERLCRLVESLALIVERIARDAARSDSREAELAQIREKLRELRAEVSASLSAPEERS